VSYSKDQFPKTQLGKVSVDGVANNGKAWNSNNKSSENEDYRIEDVVVPNEMCENEAEAWPRKPSGETETTMSLQKITDVLNKGLKNALSEIKMLKCQKWRTESKVH
jgi:hypothetical protein